MRVRLAERDCDGNTQVFRCSVKLPETLPHSTRRQKCNAETYMLHIFPGRDLQSTNSLLTGLVEVRCHRDYLR